MTEVLINMEEPVSQMYTKTKLSLRSLFPNLQDWKDAIGPLWRGSLVGFFIGVLPGAGPTIASFLSYGIEKKSAGIRRNSERESSKGLPDRKEPIMPQPEGPSSLCSPLGFRDRGSRPSFWAL